MTDALTPDLRAQLVTAAGAALRNNETCQVTDTANRAWFIGPDVVNDHSVVLISISRGSDTFAQNLSTATLVPDVAGAAIDTLDGELP